MISKRTILVVDDEEKITQVLAAYLVKEGYRVLTASNGLTAMEVFRAESISLIILDLMLPDLSGEEVCKRIRASSRVPIVMLTAKIEEIDLIEGFRLGADDYLPKPFSPRAVVAKVNAILRRAYADALSSDPVEFGNGLLRIDFNEHAVWRRGQIVDLTPNEFRILCTLAKAPGHIFTREQLIFFALGNDYEGLDRSVDSYILSLRKKLEPNRRQPILILTMHGVGYQFARRVQERCEGV